MKNFVHVAACLFVIFPTLLAAQELDTVQGEEAVKWGARLAKLAAKIEKPQVKIDPDPDRTNGVHVPDTLGLMVVPQKDLKESEELAAKFKEDAGAAIGYLFAYRVAPVIDGKTPDAGHLRNLKVTDDEGAEHSVHVFLLAVRQLAGDDYRLYVYGSDAKPLVDAKFSEGTGPGPEPVAVHVTDTDHQKQQGTVVVTLFGKYQARFLAKHTED